MKVVPLATVSALMKIDAARTGARNAASFRRGVSCGKGAVGESALQHVQWQTEMNRL